MTGARRAAGQIAPPAGQTALTGRLIALALVALVLVALVLAVSLGGCGRSAPRHAVGRSSSPDAAAARRATSYLLAAQHSDGGFGPDPGERSDGLFSGWAALGLASAGVDVAHLRHGGPSLLAAVQADRSRDTGTLERTVLVLAAASGAPATTTGRLTHRLVAALMSRRRPDGSFGEQVNLTAFGVLALRAARIAPGALTLDWLIRQADADGGFGFGPRGGASDADDTGAVLEALAAVPGRAAARARTRAVGFLRRVQDRDGGFPAAPGAGSNAQSTAWAVQGLLAAGIDPGRLRTPAGASPLAYLVELTGPDGRVSYARGTVQTPVWVTSEALMALERRPLPLR